MTQYESVCQLTVSPSRLLTHVKVILCVTGHPGVQFQLHGLHLTQDTSCVSLCARSWSRYATAISLIYLPLLFQAARPADVDC